MMGSPRARAGTTSATVVGPFDDVVIEKQARMKNFARNVKAMNREEAMLAGPQGIAGNPELEAKRLRDEEGLAYTVHANIHSSAGNLPGTFMAYIGTSPEHTGRAVAGFLEEMRRIRDEPVSEHELETAKSYLTGSYGLGFERSTRRVGYLISQHRFGLPEDHLERLPERFAAVTAEEVQAAARRHLKPEAACLAGGGPLSERDLRAALAAGGVA